jgi:hypothetical protein
MVGLKRKAAKAKRSVVEKGRCFLSFFMELNCTVSTYSRSEIILLDLSNLRHCNVARTKPIPGKTTRLTPRLKRKQKTADLGVENPILERVRSGGSGQTFALPTKKKVSKQMEVASAPTYALILTKGLKWAPVTVHSF